MPDITNAGEKAQNTKVFMQTFLGDDPRVRAAVDEKTAQLAREGFQTVHADETPCRPPDRRQSVSAPEVRFKERLPLSRPHDTLLQGQLSGNSWVKHG